ncbi:MAG: BolA family protein [Maricaulaceae bacterium]
MGIIATAIKEKLTVKFNPSHLKVIDESAKHAGHAGARDHASQNGSGESHFHVVIVSEAFHGLSRLAKHRAILEAIEDEMKMIHAFSLEASAE